MTCCHRPGRRLAREHGATLVLVSVATDGVAEAEAVLAEGRRLAGSELDVLVIEHDDPAVALGDFDASDPRTLLCMSTRGRGAVGRALIGRMALSVVEHSPHAVVLIGPRYKHQEGDAPTLADLSDHRLSRRHDRS